MLNSSKTKGEGKPVNNLVPWVAKALWMKLFGTYLYTWCENARYASSLMCYNTSLTWMLIWHSHMEYMLVVLSRARLANRTFNINPVEHQTGLCYLNFSNNIPLKFRMKELHLNMAVLQSCLLVENDQSNES